MMILRLPSLRTNQRNILRLGKTYTRQGVMSVKALTYFIVLLGIGQAFAQDPNFHIYLAFGQSNMDGAGPIEDQDKQGVDSRFVNLSGVTCDTRTTGKWIAANPPLVRCGSKLSVADYFGRTMVEKLPTTIKVGVAIVAVPGTKIELFDKDNYKVYADTTEQWMKNYIAEYGGNPYARLVELGKQAKKDGVIKGILLHQGESNNGDGKAWLGKVKKIYNNLLTDLQLDASKVPLIAGETVGQNEGGACWLINATIDKIADSIPTGHFVSSSGLAHQGDYLHFTSAAYRTYGARYATAMLALLDATPVEPIPANHDTIYNGSFAQGTRGWTLNTWAGTASGSVVNGEYALDVKTIGTSNYQIQLIQAGIILEKGKSYQIDFDAYAPTARSLEVNVEKDTDPWNSYLASLQNFNLTSTKTAYKFQFTMEADTDSSSRISFNAGGATGLLYLDNIRITAVTAPPTSIPLDRSLGKNRLQGLQLPRFDLLGRFHQ